MVRCPHLKMIKVNIIVMGKNMIVGAGKYVKMQQKSHKAGNSNLN